MNTNLQTCFFLSFTLWGCSSPCEQAVKALNDCTEELQAATQNTDMDILDVEEECAEEEVAGIDDEFFRCYADALNNADCSTEDGAFHGYMEAYSCFESEVVVEEEYEQDSYEPDDTQEAATEFSIGDSQERTLHSYNDIDFVSFEAVAGATYNLETVIDSDQTTDTHLSLLNLQEEVLAENDDYIDLESFVQWTASESGTYYVRVEAYSMGRYTLKLTEGEGVSTQ